MGYTHYWRRPSIIPSEQFEAWTEDVRTILDNLPDHCALWELGEYRDAPLRLAYEADQPDRPPLISPDIVHFNGTGPEDSDLGHETFLVPREGGSSDFCKTELKPYDLAVTACLIRLAVRCPEVTVESDGEPEEWEDARLLCERIFPGPAVLPFMDEQG